MTIWRWRRRRLHCDDEDNNDNKLNTGKGKRWEIWRASSLWTELWFRNRNWNSSVFCLFERRDATTVHHQQIAIATAWRKMKLRKGKEGRTSTGEKSIKAAAAVQYEKRETTIQCCTIAVSGSGTGIDRDNKRQKRNLAAAAYCSEKMQSVSVVISSTCTTAKHSVGRVLMNEYRKIELSAHRWMNFTPEPCGSFSGRRWMQFWFWFWF